jgi:hypothetical protein
MMIEKNSGCLGIGGVLGVGTAVPTPKTLKTPEGPKFLQRINIILGEI